MTILRTIVAAASILLVLLSTPTVVEGNCQCEEVCPNYNGKKECWKGSRYGSSCRAEKDSPTPCAAYCSCNTWGCLCKGCEEQPGDCGWSDGGCEKYGGTLTFDEYLQQQYCKGARRMMDNEEKEDTCTDFEYFRSLSADGKKSLLGSKYCDDDQVVREDIYEHILSFVLSKLEDVVLSEVVSYIQNAGGIDNVFTCDLFNKSYVDVRHLTLCADKHQHLDDGVPASNKKSKKQKKTP